MKDYPYESQLKALKLPSLEFRRKRGDMIQVFKILNGIDQIEPNIFFPMAEKHGTISHKDKMFMMQNSLEKLSDNLLSPTMLT